MSLDKTLKIRLGSSRTRNVLTRGERIARLQEEDRFAAGRSPLGLPKVRVQKALSGKKRRRLPKKAPQPQLLLLPRARSKLRPTFAVSIHRHHGLPGRPWLFALQNPLFHNSVNTSQVLSSGQ